MSFEHGHRGLLIDSVVAWGTESDAPRVSCATLVDVRAKKHPEAAGPRGAKDIRYFRGDWTRRFVGAADDTESVLL